MVQRPHSAGGRAERYPAPWDLLLSRADARPGLGAPPPPRSGAAPAQLRAGQDRQDRRPEALQPVPREAAPPLAPPVSPTGRAAGAPCARNPCPKDQDHNPSHIAPRPRLWSLIAPLLGLRAELAGVVSAGIAPPWTALSPQTSKIRSSRGRGISCPWREGCGRMLCLNPRPSAGETRRRAA